ncbi:phosphate ABC transporter permease PstA [Oceanicella actignis]|uniref:Phosphate transport system permease protein PstA n=1 Tax=Oceanicella actignis TaxID=1189325 RepID=A0A1M7SRN0_9RHOB|nr:phosphate ABC transporter permease PstA [Oceanicella actignis]SES68035.1 phosphate ABC transporter membrane protein 2, PhoT family (TC 3.A.1.7.1) [Oceanicella actignis]SHN61132.1 phosphate transport system permease protein [Oceanicella actignis]
MTDAAAADRPARDAAAAAARLRRRRRLDARLRAAGIASLLFAAGMLAILVGSLISTGAPAFTQTHVTLEFDVSAKRVKPEDPARGAYRAIVADGIGALFPEVTDRREKRELVKIVSNGAQYMLRDAVVADPSLIGTRVRMAVPVSDPYDQLAKGLVRRDDPEDRRRLSDAEIARFDKLVELGLISRPFNKALFLNADSRFPELAGLNGALWGSFYALLVCFLVSFPAGIAAGVYLEEFAPRNRLTDLIEVNINNLAAVPSVVFGLLALAVFLGWFGMPRSAPYVGGLTLALMTLPTIIIATRAALKAVPPSIREAALGIGASRHQVVFDHVLPLAMPGILTGTIIGLAQALGETAPLLLIGMNAFITAAPDGISDPATALPTQIFIWADSPERGFVSRTSAAILVLLGFLLTMNAAAIYLRKRFERKW